MELHRQRCQACGSLTHHNLIVRQPGQPAVIYVRCARCTELVARYVLAGYYHHGKGVESWLRAGAEEESGRQYLARFERVRDEALAGYAEALAELERQGKPLPSPGDGDPRDDG